MFVAPALAAGPPVTFAIAAADLSTGAPVAQIEAGKEFSYVASVGCPDPSGCGPATLSVEFPSEVEFIAGGFNPPNGATFEVTPPGLPATGKTLTVQWDNLDGTAVLFLPAKVSVDTDFVLNGTQQEAVAVMNAGSGEDITRIDDSATVTLRVFERPGVIKGTQTWSENSVADGSRAEVTSTVGATASANSLSSLTLRSPSAEAIPGASLGVSEVFNLGTLTLNQNPAGATVRFTLADGGTVDVPLTAGNLVATAPADTVAYEVTVTGLPSAASSEEAQRTVTVEAAYTLRDTRRSTGGQIIDPTATARQVRATMQATDTVTDNAPGSSATATLQNRRDITVAALVPTVAQLLTWVTSSGDQNSVYGSGEGSTATLLVANSGVPVLTDLTVTLPEGTEKYFEFQELTAIPEIHFPAGATSATIQYRYATAPREGAAQAFTAGAAVPGPEGDERELGEISGIIVTFLAEGGGILGGCALEPVDGILADCVASITLSAKLRDKQLTSNAPITPPESNPGTTSVDLMAEIRATAATGSKIRQSSNNARLSIVKPQFNAKLSKRIGDGSDQTVYPLTGVAKAGDIFDSTKTVQDFTEHAFRLTASTSPSENATEAQGADELRIADPQTEPTLANLAHNPFNVIKLTVLPTAAAQCTAEDGSPVASTTEHQVWILDRLEDPQSLTQTPYVAGMNLDLVVGFETTITPESRRFPVDVSCSTAPGAKIKFRDNRVNDGKIVSPGTVGSVDTPGLLAVGNTAELTTGLNTATATGSDELYLVDLERASVYKNYAKDARSYGIQGQGSPTAFLLSGVPANGEAVAARIVDGGSSGSSLDVFALAGLREARVGPDQTMTVSFLDRAGNPVGPTGVVEASTELKDQPLTEAEIEDSQNSRYLEFQRTPRDLDWSAEWADGDMERVFSVQVDVTRSDPEKALQRYGAFAVILDLNLRSTFLSNPANIVSGSLGGNVYLNIARISSQAPGGAWTEELTGSARYTVYAATALFGDATAHWDAADGTAYLVAQNQTLSRVRLDASNKTALGVSEVLPENQWEASGSIAVGVKSMTVGVGGTPEGAANPFAITDFEGITSVLWPDREGAPQEGTLAERQVAGAITYLFADGSTQVVPAPVGATPASLNPDAARWSQVVGVSITWEQDGRYVGIKRTEGERQGQLIFGSSLRDFVREGYRYTFSEGVPQSLESGASIDGAFQIPGNTVDQFAVQNVDYRIDLDDLEKTAVVPSNQIAIDVAQSTVAVNVARTGSAALNRDLLPSTQWTLNTRNTGNIPVSSLRMATASELLDAATWDGGDPAGYTLERGSVFDAFNVTRASVTYPAGASSATVSVRGEDGAWSAGFAAGNGSNLTLPQTGDGPKNWAEVTGFRVQFDGNEALRQRIAKQGLGNLIIETTLRQNLRTDSSERAPGTELPADKAQWTVPMTGAGASYIGTFIAPLAQVTAAPAAAVISPGAPGPLVRKYARNYSVGTNVGTTSTQANPGSWVNFFVTLENRGNASSDLYNLSVVDTLPDELHYNAMSPAQDWEVISAPEGISTTPTLEVGAASPTTMTWTWPTDQVLHPGGRIVIRVPLQVSDGVPTGGSGQNAVRLIGEGIEGATVPSVCENPASTNASCLATANVISLRSDSVRVESFIDSSIGGASMIDGAVCDDSTFAEWGDGKWVRNPCITDTTVGATLKYRAKLINSGNSELSEMRFVDELPRIGDQGTVLDAARNSAWSPSLVPGSVRLLGGTEATDLGARGDGALSAGGFRYSSSAKACTLRPDGFAGDSTLSCDAGTWSATPTTSSASLGGDIVFDEANRLRGGEYVVVEFELTVPATGDVAKLAWNSAAATGRASAISNWLPASESPRSGARAQDTDLRITLALTDDQITPWHLNAEEYELTYSCLAPGATDPVRHTVTLDGIDTVAGTRSALISNLPIGAECAIVDENYVPVSVTAPGQYGSVEDGASGFSFGSDPADAIILDADTGLNVIAVTNLFTPTSVELGVSVAGNAASYLPADATFDVAMQCSFGGFTRDYGPFSLRDGETHTVENLPVGANCLTTETEHRGASTVTATVDGTDAPLTAERSLTATALDPGAHEIHFVNLFEAGGDLTILKRVETPAAGTAVGDVSFELTCTLGGFPMDLGDRATLGLSIPEGETSASISLEGLPVGAECVVHESDAGGANIAAPDRTATVLADTEVIVEMVNRYSPAALSLDKRVAGPGAAESRVPASFEVAAMCTRDLTVGGRELTVTDFNGVVSVTPGTPTTVPNLPEGSRCAVTEPNLAGAESVTVDPVTAGVVDESERADSALIALRGPDAAGAAVPTEVRIVNTYAATPGTGGKPGLSTTGSDPGPLLSAALMMLLLGGGALLLRRRREGNA